MAYQFVSTESDSKNQWTTAHLELSVVTVKPAMAIEPQSVIFQSSNEEIPTQFEHGYALLIGVDENASPEFSLPVVGHDLAALTDVLTNTNYCGYLPENVKVLRGKVATRSNIFDGLEWLHDRLQSDNSRVATAIIYYSGHGLRDNSEEREVLYLIPYDSQRRSLKRTALRATEFVQYVNGMKFPRLLIIFDCSHAGGMGVEVAKMFSGSYSYAVLASSQSNEQAYVRSDGQMSIFTYHLIEALTGSAQTEEGDSEVFVADVISYVARHVPRSVRSQHKSEQRPEFRMSGDNFPIGLLLGGKGITKGSK